MNENLSQAIQEAYASATAAEIIYHTMEINTATISQPLYFVQSNDKITARIEHESRFNAGQLVEFNNYPFDFKLPKKQSNTTPELLIEIDNVDFSFVQTIENLASQDDEINIIYRIYAHSNLESYSEPPLELQVNSIKFNTQKITITAKFDDFANKSFPSKTYRPVEFPALAR